MKKSALLKLYLPDYKKVSIEQIETLFKEEVLKNEENLEDNEGETEKIISVNEIEKLLKLNNESEENEENDDSDTTETKHVNKQILVMLKQLLQKTTT